MFRTFFICHLDCCNALVTGIAKGQGKRLQAVQNASARLVSGLIAVTTQCHYWAIFFGCQWDDQGVASRVIFKTAVLVWKCIHGVTAVYLQELCTQVDSIRGRPKLRSASTGGIQLPRVQTSVAQWSFAYSGRQCGTVCQQHCETVACHYTHSSGDWKRTYLQHDEHRPALLRRFCESRGVI